AAPGCGSPCLSRQGDVTAISVPRNEGKASFHLDARVVAVLSKRAPIPAQPNPKKSPPEPPNPFVPPSRLSSAPKLPGADSLISAQLEPSKCHTQALVEPASTSVESVPQIM